MKKYFSILILLSSCSNQQSISDAEAKDIMEHGKKFIDSMEKADKRAGKKEIKHAYLNANDAALKKIREEKKVKEAFFNDASVLYISVIDDGTRRNGYAEYLCSLLKEYKADVHKVKIVKFGSTDDPNKDNAYGILLGESDCN